MKHSLINWPLLIEFLKAQVGKPYIFGQENPLDEKDWTKYKAWDCSELMEVAYHKIGLMLPDGSYNQAKMCVPINGEVEEFPKKLLIGDLGFKAVPETGIIHHVGAYIGDGILIEAKGKQWGGVETRVNDFMAWSHFCLWGGLKSVEDA